MSIKVGDKLPSGTFMTWGAGGPEPVSADDMFAGKTVALFSLPGAFTPTCSAKHLPSYKQKAEDLKARGVDSICCTAVNDVFVLHAWEQAQGTEGAITMLADGNGDYVKALGLDFDGSGFGMGRRGQRFSLLAKDGVVTHINVEEPGEYRVSSAEYLLDQL